MEKKLKVILVAIFAILLTLIAFVGIYVNKDGVYKNIMPEYLLDSNLQRKVVFELAVDTTKNKVTYDADGKVVENTEKTDENSEEDTSNYTTVEEPVNPEENLTQENYKKAKEIIGKRLDTINVKEYRIRLNESNGTIIIEVPENSQIEELEMNLTSIGSFEIVDSEDDKVLLNNDDLDKVQVAYNTDTIGTTIYLTIGFNKEGTKKLENISNEYTLITNENDETTKKEVTLKMENEKILSTYFDKPITDGKLQLTVGNASADAETVKKYLESASDVAMLLNCGKMPLIYNIASEKDINPVVNEDTLSIAIYGLIGILVISFIYLVIKHKKYGALAIIGSIIAVDVLLIIIRYTDVHLSIESAIAFIVLILLNSYIISNLVKNLEDNYSKEAISKNIKEGWLKSIDMLVVMLILSVVFTFISWSEIGNIGILIFWGIICICLSHLIFTRALLLNSNK